MLFCEVREDPRKRRDRFEIIAEILKAARVGIQKTQIMYQAGLSFALLTEYLSFLVKLGLLEARKKNQVLIYKTTPKGKRYVKRYEEIKLLLQKNTGHSVTDFSPPSPFPKRSA